MTTQTTTTSCSQCSRPASVTVAGQPTCCQHAQQAGRKAHKPCPCRHGITVTWGTV